MLAQVAAMGGVDDPTAILRDAIGEAYRDRIWFEVWIMIEAQARWWANHDHLEAAAIAVGYLDAHQVGSMSHGSTDATRAAVRAHPDADHWLAFGATLDRDQLVAYVLDYPTPA